MKRSADTKKGWSQTQLTRVYHIIELLGSQCNRALFNRVRPSHKSSHNIPQMHAKICRVMQRYALLSRQKKRAAISDRPIVRWCPRWDVGVLPARMLNLSHNIPYL